MGGFGGGFMMRLSRGGGGWIEVEIELNGLVEVEVFLLKVTITVRACMHVLGV